MARAELLGWGVQVTYPNLTESSLSWALNEVLTNQKYKKNVDEIAIRLRDQPQTPMEKAVFWVEYVDRHKGAHFMQTSAQYLNFIEYHNLDIYFTLATLAFLIVFVPIYLIRKVLRFFLKKSTKPKKQKSS
jgi:glucuronosyltransferase